jgi:hypothetical protein
MKLVVAGSPESQTGTRVPATILALTLSLGMECRRVNKMDSPLVLVFCGRLGAEGRSSSADAAQTIAIISKAPACTARTARAQSLPGSMSEINVRVQRKGHPCQGPSDVTTLRPTLNAGRQAPGHDRGNLLRLHRVRLACETGSEKLEHMTGQARHRDRKARLSQKTSATISLLADFDAERVPPRCNAKLE